MGRAAASCDCQALRKKSIPRVERAGCCDRRVADRLGLWTSPTKAQGGPVGLGVEEQRCGTPAVGPSMRPGFLHLSPLQARSYPGPPRAVIVSLNLSALKGEDSQATPAGRGLPSQRLKSARDTSSSAIRCSQKLTSKKRRPLGVPRCGTLFRIERRTECGRGLSSQVWFCGPESLTL
jgi:hypothetical protein